MGWGGVVGWDAGTVAGAELTAMMVLVMAAVLMVLVMVRGSKTPGRGWLEVSSSPPPPPLHPNVRLPAVRVALRRCLRHTLRADEAKPAPVLVSVPAPAALPAPTALPTVPPPVRSVLAPASVALAARAEAGPVVTPAAVVLAPSGPLRVWSGADHCPWVARGR